MASKIIEVIDDEEDIISLISSLVAMHFKDVRVFTSTGCCNLGMAPDVLIIDYLMPQKSGFEQIKCCAARGHFPKTLLWTAWAAEVLDEIEILKKINPSIVVVQKPETEELVAAIKRMLEIPSLISICAECKNPIYWIDKIDPDIKICEACRDEK